MQIKQSKNKKKKQLNNNNIIIICRLSVYNNKNKTKKTKISSDLASVSHKKAFFVLLGHALPPLDWVIHLLPTKLITSMTQQYIEGRRQSKERERERETERRD
jgi:hypothetical protein